MSTSLKTLEEFEKMSFDERKSEYARASKTDRIPILVKTDSNMKLKNFKYLVQPDMQLSNFIGVIRKRLDISNSEALFLLDSSKRLPKLSDLTSDLPKSDDGFIRVSISKENTFG